MTDRKPSLILPVAVVAALLLAGYVRAYYATVTRWHSVPNYPAITRFLPDGSHITVRGFFLPIHAIDRRIRSDFWEVCTQTSHRNTRDRDLSQQRDG